MPQQIDIWAEDLDPVPLREYLIKRISDGWFIDSMLTMESVDDKPATVIIVMHKD